ncbi:MAG: hypothetical protein MMC23_006525 [Stictis urceolatum]|nr:hypothetical protein [Stictis urceolata]
MSDPLPPDPYKALGIPKDAATDAVKKAFRKLALTCHPDKTKALPECDRKTKEEQFHSIKNAHDLLVDDDERRHYDLKVERDSLLRRPTYGPSKLASASAAPQRPTSSKSTTTPIFRDRPSPIYETREPKFSSYENKKSSYDDYAKPRFESRRSAAKPTYDDYHYDDISPASSRRSSGRVVEERDRERERRERRLDDERYYKKLEEQRLKEKERKLRADRERRRDTERRQDAQYKNSPRVETDSESDSDVGRFMDSSRRSPERRPKYDDRKFEPRKSSRREEERPRRRSSEESESSDDDRHYSKGYDDRASAKIAQAAHYIKQSSGKTVSEDRHEKRPAMVRTRPTATKRVAAPPPAPPAPLDSSKRSSGRRGPEKVKSTTKDRSKIEIVDAPPREDYFNHDDREYREAREQKKSTGSRMPLKPSATFNDKTQEKPALLKRAQTLPLTRMDSSAGHTPARSSKLKQHTELEEISSSDSRSPSPPSTRYKTSYRIKDDDRQGSGRFSSVVEISPEREPARRRAESPRVKQSYVERERERPTAPPTVSAQRRMPIRSNTNGFEPEPPRRSATHSAFNSGDKMPHGEYKTPEYDVSYGRAYTKADIKYADYSGRGSADDSHDRKLREAQSYMRAQPSYA